MNRGSTYHGGIVFAGGNNNDLNSFCRIVAATLEDYGHQVERQSVQNRNLARVVTSQYHVRLTLDEPSYRSDGKTDARRGAAKADEPVRHRVVVTLSPAAEGCEDRDITELMLVVMLYRMVDLFNTEVIEWMDPNTVLTLEQFLSAFSSVSPHRVNRRNETLDERGSALESAEDEVRTNGALHDDMHSDPDPLVELSEEEVLALAFREEGGTNGQNSLHEDEKSQNDVMRLAVWGMTGMVAFLSAPVAASMAAVNIARGEDFRLNTQVLSLTGLLTVLHGTGTLADVMNSLPI